MKHIITTLLLIVTFFSVKAEVLNIGTYNLRCPVGSDSVAGNVWGNRYPVIASIIQFQEFDIIGTQECVRFQLEDLKRAMPGYDYVGAGRDDGKEKGEHSAIFYRADKFEVVEHGDFWLSEHTDYSNLGWDAVCPRICTWALFRNRMTGNEIMYYNLHMDHKGVVARRESVKMIEKRISESGHSIPVILTGDFNVSQNNELFSLMGKSGVLFDAYSLAPIKMELNGTFNNWNTETFSTDRIDHVFVTSNVKVRKHGVLTYTYRVPATTDRRNKDADAKAYIARNPSDHFPVAVTIEIQNQK